MANGSDTESDNDISSDEPPSSSPQLPPSSQSHTPTEYKSKTTDQENRPQIGHPKLRTDLVRRWLDRTF